MNADARTRAVYDARARDYACTVGDPRSDDSSLGTFLQALPEGGHILDLGCGPGRWAALMLAKGFSVEGIDASAEMVALAAQVAGFSVRQASFEDVAPTPAFDGIWANFSLLHATRAEVPGLLARLHGALRPGGVLHVGVKSGTGETRDALGRRYTYFTDDEMRRLLRAAGFSPVEASLQVGADKGLDGQVSSWFTLIAHA